MHDYKALIVYVLVGNFEDILSSDATYIVYDHFHLTKNSPASSLSKLIISTNCQILVVHFLDEQSEKTIEFLPVLVTVHFVCRNLKPLLDSDKADWFMIILHQR